jgi:hypothetical protein
VAERADPPVGFPIEVRFVAGEEVRQGVVVAKIAFVMPIADMMKLAKSLNDLVTHYMNEARNAQRIVVPKA